MLKRLILILLGAVFITLALSSLALAFTPEEIYNDMADGTLDGTYTCEELKNAIGDATLNQYGDQAILDALEEAYNHQCREEFPFTGFQMLIAGIVAIVLIAGGFALRRFSRPQRS